MHIQIGEVINMTRPVTRTKQYFTDDLQTAALEELFDQWMGELPNSREITFKANRDNWSVFVVYTEVVGDDDYDRY